MTMVTDEKEGACFWHVYLHANQAIGMTWQMVQGDPLTEVHSLVIERLPVP